MGSRWNSTKMCCYKSSVTVAKPAITVNVSSPEGKRLVSRWSRTGPWLSLSCRHPEVATDCKQSLGWAMLCSRRLYLSSHVGSLDSQWRVTGIGKARFCLSWSDYPKCYQINPEYYQIASWNCLFMGAQGCDCSVAPQTAGVKRDQSYPQIFSQRWNVEGVFFLFTGWRFSVPPIAVTLTLLTCDESL